MKHRFEAFGGIISSEDPPFLAYVDRQFMRAHGLGESALWATDNGETIGLLSAPTEVHIATTNACPVRCPHCYMDSGEASSGQMDTPTFRRALEALARAGVFHVAMGGGEALAESRIFELASHARQLGMVPNLTTSGAGLTEALARQMDVFGQVNVSMDGVGPAGGAFRLPGLFAMADRAVDLLVAAGVPTGINCVVGRRNFDGIEALFDYAGRKGVNEIELLRLKPVGRARASFARERTTHEQNKALTPMVARLSERTGLYAKIDCSFVPMLCYHAPPHDLLEKAATYGCEAANVLVGVSSEGAVAGCSFLPKSGVSVFELQQAWRSDPGFAALRAWPEQTPEPCRGCDYLQVCKGGCHAVAAAVTGDAKNPDPGCPRVVDYLRKGSS